ncbi:Hypothetical protein, putative tetrapyrrole methylase [Mycoplasma yeatsii 13926]|uniref:Ribosomal RNA small subunit methyltransferase I n=1 Tax=Mycoplasma yeatsii 13926 TaxID=1188240 RepID=S6G3C7_9MOLU|nr:16S rRNA (cytidine(1402)-2'-O)-methyltransferase [Mycoplasma yeatsii]EOA06971.1 Hypothetical protein, putative tetrapyrrole methylase [Mycoplasma yeatsii 13926]
MILQKTFKNNKPTIYLITTPIGNLDDINKRSLETLQSVDFIFCEDTRTSKVLLDKYNISNNLISFHMHNEDQRINQIIDLVNQNKNIAIISDAGVPIISDPAGYLISQLRQLNINCNITAIGTGSAYIHALICSGFNSKTNYFYGFIENKNKQSKIKELTNLINKYNDTVISFYESVHRIKQTVECLNKILDQNHKIVIARELTKINEEIVYGSISEINSYVNSDEFISKGEFVIVIDKQNQKLINNDYSDQEIIKLIDEEMNLNDIKLKKACEIISQKTNKSKNELYNMYILNKTS